MTLLKLNDNEFILRYDETRARFCSSIENLFVLGKVLKMDLNELEIALVEMNRQDHNFAEFGNIRSTFIYSKRI